MALKMLRLMIPRDLRLALAITCTVVVSVLSAACEKTPFLAPSGSSITLTTSTNAIAAGGSATIIAQVLEAAGTPPHSGTQVTFMTTLGVVEPATASTDSAGRAVVTFRPNGANGVAVISAASGGATTSATGGTPTPTTGTGNTSTAPATGDRNLRINVGSAAVGRILLSANPAVLNPGAFAGNGGGSSVSLAANVIDINGNALLGVPVTFTATAGTLSQVTVNTDGNGNAFNTLVTNQAATVTAGVGLAGATGGGGGGTTPGNNNNNNNNSGATTNNVATVNITLIGIPIVVITVPTDLPSSTLPSNYTIKVTPATSGGGTPGSGENASSGAAVAIRSVVVDWGDGRIESLGAVSGEQVVAHTYAAVGTYTIRVTAEDVAGARAQVSTTVAVIEPPVPTITVSYSPSPARTGVETVFTIQATVARGLQITSGTIDFGNGQFAGLGGGTALTARTTYGATGTYTVRISLTDSSGRTTTTFSTVSVAQ